jgi:hypothetical protein
VLPRVPYRQRTLSFPHRVRWVLLKEAGLLSDVLTLFLRAVFALQRRRARRQGLRGGQFGAVSFIPFFGSALQVTPHFHSLVPDGDFVPQEDGMRFEVLPRLRKGPRMRSKCTQRTCCSSGCAGRRWRCGPLPESSSGVPLRRALACTPTRTFTPTTGKGWSGCAATGRGALALERLSRAEDGRIRYRMKRPLPDGTTHLPRWDEEAAP